MDAFDADVLIYAAVDAHPLGTPVRRLLDLRPGVGSVLLLPELLTKPTRQGRDADAAELLLLLSHLDLLPCDDTTARLAVTLGATYGLRAADAIHLATAVHAGADRIITNNRKDFTPRITEIDVTYPEDLTGPTE